MKCMKLTFDSIFALFLTCFYKVFRYWSWLCIVLCSHCPCHCCKMFHMCLYKCEIFILTFFVKDIYWLPNAINFFFFFRENSWIFSVLCMFCLSWKHLLTFRIIFIGKCSWHVNTLYHQVRVAGCKAHTAEQSKPQGSALPAPPPGSGGHVLCLRCSVARFALVFVQRLGAQETTHPCHTPAGPESALPQELGMKTYAHFCLYT